jgi:KipI family sensor histidine kinase inhibitor
VSAEGGPSRSDANDRIVPFGDSAVLLTLFDRVDPTPTARAQSIADAVDRVRAAQLAIGRRVPALASVLVPFDPLAIDTETVVGIVEAAVRVSGQADSDAAYGSGPAREPIEIAVRYGGQDGPDLDAVASLHGLRPRDVVELHAGAIYDVLFLGFAPGFAYLGGLPPAVATPRRATPRARVPAGSVGIGGEHTGIYPLAMPGGWQLIGRAEARLWDVTRPSPALLGPGDRVRFVPRQ